MKRVMLILVCAIYLVVFAIPASAIMSIEVRGIKIQKEDISLRVGETSTLKVTFIPVNTTQKKLSFATSNKNIATVDNNGRVKGVGKGSAVITVSSSINKKVTAKCKVTIISVKPVKLVLWGGVPEDKGPNEVCENYSKIKPNVSVKYYRYVNDEAGNLKLDMGLAAGEKIDMFISYNPSQRDRRIDNKSTADITDLAKKYDIDMIRDFGSIASTSLRDGRIFTIPTYKFVGFIAYNKNLFDAAKITAPTKNTTWEEWREIAKKLTSGTGNNKQTGIYIPGAAGGDFYITSFLSTKYPNSYPWLNKDASASEWKTNPDFKKAYQLANDIMYIDKSAYTWEQCIVEKVDAQFATLFTTEKVASVMVGSYFLRIIKDTTTYPHNFKTAFAPYPKFDKNQSKYYANIQTNDHFAIANNCKEKDEAIQFLKWYYTQGYDPMIKNGRIPMYVKYDPNKAFKAMSEGYESLIDEKTLKETLFGDYSDMIVNGNGIGLNELKQITKEESEAYFLKQITIDQLMDNLQKRSDEVLKFAK